MLLPTSLRYSLAVRAIEGKLTVEDIQQSTTNIRGSIVRHASLFPINKTKQINIPLPDSPTPLSHIISHVQYSS
jgi:hypothetical protein